MLFRSLVVLFGVLGLPLIYVLARRLFVTRAPLAARRAGQVASLAALLVLVVSPFHIAYSQDLTMYSLLFVMLTLSGYTLLRALDRGRGRAAWLAWGLYAVVTLAAMHTHYYAAFAVAAQALYVLLCHRRALLAWVGAQFIVAAGFLPWLYLNYRLLAGQTVDRTEHLSLGNLAFILKTAALGFTVGPTFPAAWAWLGWAFVVLLLAALVALLARRATRDTGALLGLWLLVPVPFAWAFDVVLQHFGERFVSMSLPALALLLGWAISRVPPQRGRAGPILLAGAYALASLVALRGWYFDPAFLKSRYGEMLALISRQAQPGDALLLDGTEQAILYRIYQPANLAGQFISPDSVLTPAAADRDFPALVAGHPRVWLVLFGAPSVYDPRHQAEAWLAAHGYKAFYEPYPGSEVTLYVMGSATPPLQDTDQSFTTGPRLTGFSFTPAVARLGDTLLVTLQWQATTPMALDYTVYTQLRDASGRVAAQLDSQPASGTRPTSGWQPGETVLDRKAILLPPDLPPGDYTLQVGLYELATLKRLTLAAGGADHVYLGAVQVLP